MPVSTGKGEQDAVELGVDAGEHISGLYENLMVKKGN
jgi:hypothetical protein